MRYLQKQIRKEKLVNRIVRFLNTKITTENIACVFTAQLCEISLFAKFIIETRRERSEISHYTQCIIYNVYSRIEGRSFVILKSRCENIIRVFHRKVSCIAGTPTRDFHSSEISSSGKLVFAVFPPLFFSSFIFFASLIQLRSSLMVENTVLCERARKCTFRMKDQFWRFVKCASFFFLMLCFHYIRSGIF